jgi:type III secretory pathway lipoprotein EscJ
LVIDRIILVALEKNTPIKMNGIPNPNEYASNKLNDMDGVVAAKVRIVPSIGPTHGVHPAANAKPNTNDIG